MVVAEGTVKINIEVDEGNLDKIKKKEAQQFSADLKGTGAVQKGATGSKSAVSGFGGGMIGNATKGLNMAKGGAMNPLSMIQGNILPMVMKFIPKMLLKAIPVVGWALLAVEIVPIIIKEVIKALTSVGAPFDKRFKRIIKDEVNGFFTREEQQRRRLGLDPVIMTTVVGFRNNGGLQTVNTLNKVAQTGVSGIGLTMKAQGVQ
jgi:hypothetical protein